MALESSPDKPIPVRVVSSLIGQWIARLGRIWVEGQVTQLTRRPGARTVYLTLRDPAADISISVTCPTIVLDRLPAPLGEGASVILAARPDFYAARGSLSLAATEIRPVGIGELLARLEQLKRTLASEGLFAADRKKPLPFLPRRIGLICGRASAAERDVVENSRRRWPGAGFLIREVAVQGVNAVSEVCAALGDLDADASVDVIIITRGGGSVEDLLPFSNEALIRAVSSCHTPVVSAIGHETDMPLLDLVADVRASTPTDAAKCVVPDLQEELARIDGARGRARRAVVTRLDRESAAVAALRSRPVLHSPAAGLDARADAIGALRDRAARCVDARLSRGSDDVGHIRARLTALSPAATLARGYAVVTTPDGQVVRSPAAAPAGTLLSIRLAEGGLDVVVPPAARAARTKRAAAAS